MLQLEFRSIEQWPGKFTSPRKRARFATAWAQTQRLLETELKHLRAESIILQAAVQRSQIKNNGMLYADAQPQHPGVILSFYSKHGPLSYPCDTFDRWQDNVRAIALSLNALRQVDRYGVTKRAEQYKGFERLEAPKATTREDIRHAANLLCTACDGHASMERIIESTDVREAAYRRALFKVHPDHGGNAEDFQKVQAAKELLDRAGSK